MENINFIAFDFETAKSRSGACQLGIVVVRKGIIIEEKSYLIQPPGNKYDRKAILIHGIYPEDTKNAPTFGELWPQIKCFFDHQLIVCHNSSFDLDVLIKEFEYYKIEDVKLLSLECTYSLLDQMSLEHACYIYDIPIENHHDALADARACARVFIEYLMDREDKKLELYYKGEDGWVPKHREPKKLTEDSTRLNDSGIEIHKKIAKEFRVTDLVQADANSPFYGKKVLITGAFDMGRDLLASIVSKKMGAYIMDSISKNTEIVLAGSEPGPVKMEKIHSLKEKGINIVVYNEEETMPLITPYLD